MFAERMYCQNKCRKLKRNFNVNEFNLKASIVTNTQFINRTFNSVFLKLFYICIILFHLFIILI